MCTLGQSCDPLWLNSNGTVCFAVWIMSPLTAGCCFCWAYNWAPQVDSKEMHEKREQQSVAVEKLDDGTGERRVETEQVAEKKVKQQVEEGDGFKVETVEVSVHCCPIRTRRSVKRVNTTRDKTHKYFRANFDHLPCPIQTGGCDEKSCCSFGGDASG